MFKTQVDVISDVKIGGEEEEKEREVEIEESVETQSCEEDKDCSNLGSAGCSDERHCVCNLGYYPNSNGTLCLAGITCYYLHLLGSMILIYYNNYRNRNASKLEHL